MKCIKIVKWLEFVKEKMAPLRFFKTLVNGMVAMAKKNWIDCQSRESRSIFFFGIHFLSLYGGGGSTLSCEVLKNILNFIHP